jgi:predicted MPP superfamily phosphohydrolase
MFLTDNIILKAILFIVTVCLQLPISTSLNAQFSVQFNAPGTYIKHGNTAALQLPFFTAEGWFMMDGTGETFQPDTSGSEIIPLISKGFKENTHGGGINYLLGIRASDRVLYAVFEENLAPGYPRRYKFLEGFTPLPEHQWFHAAMTFDGTSLVLCLNGNPESLVETACIPRTACLNDLAIGTSLDAAGGFHGHFEGATDALRIWDHARSQEEIREYLNLDIEQPVPGLVMALNLNEGEGSSLHATGILNHPGMVGDQFSWETETRPELLIPPACNFMPVMQIGLISDPQYCDCNNTTSRYYRETPAKLLKAVDTLNRLKVDFVMNLGDMIDRFPQSYDVMLPLFDSLSMPVYKLFGNHEFSEIPDTFKLTLTEKLKMPGRYYGFSFRNWRFLVLDATELAAYSMVLHPELQAEGDSLWQHVQGQINAYEWNGGISRNQMEWIRQQLTDSYKKSERVILFCHHQVYPFNDMKNLWNDTAVVELISGFPNVVAFVNGHNHDGNYGFYRGIHFLTHRAMVETRETNSFSTLTVYPDRIELDGRGLNHDRLWLYDNDDTLSRYISITDNRISSRDTAGTFMGRLQLRREDDTAEEAVFQLTADTLYGSFFALSGDSLFLNTNEDLSGKGNDKIRISAMNCLNHVFALDLSLEFDSLTLYRTGSLPDTVVDVFLDSISIPLGRIFADSTREGYILKAESMNQQIAAVEIDRDRLICRPQNMGETQIVVSATDIFTKRQASDTFRISIERLSNQAPMAMSILDALELKIIGDTLEFSPDTLFADPDGDTLYYDLVTSDPQIVAIEEKEGSWLMKAAGEGEAAMVLTADDHYGGICELCFNVMVREQIIVTGGGSEDYYYDFTCHASQNELVVSMPGAIESVHLILTNAGGNKVAEWYRTDLAAGRNVLKLEPRQYPPGAYMLTLVNDSGLKISHKLFIIP